MTREFHIVMVDDTDEQFDDFSNPHGSRRAARERLGVMLMFVPSLDGRVWAGGFVTEVVR